MSNRQNARQLAARLKCFSSHFYSGNSWTQFAASICRERFKNDNHKERESVEQSTKREREREEYLETAAEKIFGLLLHIGNTSKRARAYFQNKYYCSKVVGEFAATDKDSQ